MDADFHIGNMIQAQLKVQGRTMTWFANAIHYDRSNVYKMLKHETIDLVLLMRISELLNYDFLHDCSNALTFEVKNRQKHRQPSENRKKQPEKGTQETDK